MFLLQTYITCKIPTLAEYERRYGPLPPKIKEKFNVDPETLKPLSSDSSMQILYLYACIFLITAG